jgi:hypothetical protein
MICNERFAWCLSFRFSSDDTNQKPYCLPTKHHFEHVIYHTRVLTYTFVRRLSDTITNTDPAIGRFPVNKDGHVFPIISCVILVYNRYRCPIKSPSLCPPMVPAWPKFRPRLPHSQTESLQQFSYGHRFTK